MFVVLCKGHYRCRGRHCDSQTGMKQLRDVLCGQGMNTRPGVFVISTSTRNWKMYDIVGLVFCPTGAEQGGNVGRT